MKTRTIVIEFGPCGFGYAKDKVREVRVGLARVSVFVGSISALLEKAHKSLGDAVCELRRQK